MGILKSLQMIMAFLSLRTSDEEKWVIMVNNTGKTQRVDLTPEQLGEGKMLNGILHEEKVRINEKEVYPVILDREMVEIYQVRNDEGLNTLIWWLLA